MTGIGGLERWLCMSLELPPTVMMGRAGKYARRAGRRAELDEATVPRRFGLNRLQRATDVVMRLIA